MPVVSSIRHVAFVVRDLEVSLQFYSGLLGLSVYLRRTEEGDFIDALTGMSAVRLEWVKLVIPKGGLIELLQYYHPSDASASQTPHPSPSNKLGCSHVALTIEDLPTLYERLIAAGYHCNSAPLLAPGGRARILYCHDPDGAILELIEDLSPS